MKLSATTCCLLLALGLSANAARGQDKGLAAKYPKDVGIGRNLVSKISCNARE